VEPLRWHGFYRMRDVHQDGARVEACWRVTMDQDRIEGAAKKVKGSVKEAIGKVTGDAKTEAEGNAEKNEGRIQNAVGGMKDSLREAAGKK
jgi:uncharacterized protein YjbJ (UPF0337 family)